MENKFLNNKIILPEVGPLDFEFGGMAAAEDIILFPDGNFIPFLPEYETQANTYFDDFGCVSHSFENACEAFINSQIDNFSPETSKWIKDNFFKNGKCNFSDRDLVVLSGTTNDGNSGNKVLETAQKIGLIPQTAGDFDSFSRDTKLTKQYYYAYARTPEAQPLADEWNKRVKILGEWVDRNNWEEASKRGALQIYVNAWFIDENGVYYNPTGRYNHAVFMAHFKEVKIFDTYKPEIKQLKSWNDAYSWALKINIIENIMTKPIIEKNTLVQLIDKNPGGGQFGLYLDGNILVDQTGELLATFYMRNNGDTKGKTKPLTREEWNMFPKKNLKMQSV